jgi:hypothetical protein
VDNRLNHEMGAAITLTQEQVRSYAEKGHLTLDAITTPDEALQIRAMIQRLFEERTGEREGAYGELVAWGGQSKQANSPQILNPINYCPKLHKTKCFRNALHIAKQLLGEDARFFLDLSIMKSARLGLCTPWHQDAAYRDPRFEYRELTIWVALQEVGNENGCLKFISGSHLSPVLEHRPANECSASQALQCIGLFDESAAVACPLPAGGCTIHHPGTLHYAGPNLSETHRFAYIMVFGVTPRRRQGTTKYPWLDRPEIGIQIRKRQWMRRGGMFITAWRRMRRGDLSSWQSLAYWVARSIRTVCKGG